jgi:hypothetical protein
VPLPALEEAIAEMNNNVAADQVNLLAALGDPDGPTEPAAVFAAVQQLAGLQAAGADMSFALPAIRTTIHAWSAYASGPRMWSDNYAEDEQEREVYGPAIQRALLTVLMLHTLREGDRASIDDLLQSFSGSLSLFYAILHDLLPTRQDISLLLAAVVEYTGIIMKRPSQSDATIYDCLCAIQNLSYAMPHDPAAPYAGQYARLLLDELQRLRLSKARRPDLRTYLDKVKATYTARLQL